MFFFSFLFFVTEGRSQGRLASNKKLIFKGSPPLLELIFVLNFCWNTLLMSFQKTQKIAQKQPPPPPLTPCWLSSHRSPSRLCPPPKKNLKWRPWRRRSSGIQPRYASSRTDSNAALPSFCWQQATMKGCLEMLVLARTRGCRWWGSRRIC